MYNVKWKFVFLAGSAMILTPGWNWAGTLGRKQMAKKIDNHKAKIEWVNCWEGKLYAMQNSCNPFYLDAQD